MKKRHMNKDTNKNLHILEIHNCLSSEYVKGETKKMRRRRIKRLYNEREQADAQGDSDYQEWERNENQ